MNQQNQSSGSQSGKTGSGTPYAFSLSDNALTEIKKHLGGNMRQQDDGTILLENVVIGNEASIKKFNEVHGGSR